MTTIDESGLAHLDQAHAYAKAYLSGAEAKPPFPTQAAIDALAGFDEPWPQGMTPASQVLAMLDRLGSPATARTTGGRYYGFVMGGTLPSALGASWLASAWDQNAGNRVSSPVGAKLEQVASEWILEALDLPRSSVVAFVTGATMANFSSLAVARSALLERAGWDLRTRGISDAPRLRYVASAEEHPSVRKALTMLGIGQAEVEWIPVDAQGRVRPADLRTLDERTILLLQAGNVNSGSFDPFVEVCRRAREAGAWVHVDGAFGLWIRASRSRRHLADGVELADSWAVDAHKWLNVPYDSAFYICRDRRAAQRTFGLDAPYLVRGGDHEPNDYTPELSRRARGVEIWAALKHLGREGLEALIDRCCGHAQRFAEGLADAGYEILNEVVINQVVVAVPNDLGIDEIIGRIQDSGVCWLGPTYWRGRRAMRISVSSWMTSESDVETSLNAMVKALGN